MNQRYTNTQENLLNEKILLELLLYRTFLKTIGTCPYKLSEFPNLKENGDKIINEKTLKKYKDYFQENKQITIDEINIFIEDFRKYIQKKTSSNLPEDGLDTLVNLFQLSELERQIIVYCATIMESTQFQLFNSLLFKDKENTLPSLSNIKKILCETDEEQKQAQYCFSHKGNLFKYDIVKQVVEGDNNSFITNNILLHDRIYNYIHGVDISDDSIDAFTKIYEPHSNNSVTVDKSFATTALSFISNTNNNYCYHLHGLHSSLDDIPRALCSKMGINLLSIDCNGLIANTPTLLNSMLKTIERESILKNSAICFFNTSALTSYENTNSSDIIRNTFFNYISSLDTTVFICSKDKQDVYSPKHKNKIFSIKVPDLTYLERKKLWEDTLKTKNEEIDILASTYNLNAREIHDAAEQAQSLSLWEGEGDESISINNLYEGSKIQIAHNLDILATKVRIKAKWDDIILPDEDKMQLREIINRYIYKDRVFTEWNFDDKLSYGKGLTTLFHGVSGTGKSMAAEIIAGELNLDLYRIDLSSIVSKYIGETEKNLEKIFDEAAHSNAILFFDEADALFGKRSQVKDAHDRYANIEVGYLLQRIEQYEGIIILATNMLDNIDNAFLRRMKFKVPFKSPKDDTRLTLWKNVFPEETPLDDEIDFTFLGTNLEFTGAEIKEIAETALFYAASEEADTVTMRHIILGCRKAMLKKQKICSDKIFGEYFQYISDFEESVVVTKKKDPEKYVPPTEERLRSKTEVILDEEGKIIGKKERHVIRLKDLEKKYGKKYGQRK